MQIINQNIQNREGKNFKHMTEKKGATQNKGQKFFSEFSV